MPTWIVAVTEKTQVSPLKYDVTTIKILKINAIDTTDLLRKAVILKARILENYKDPKPEIVHRVLAQFAEDF